MTYVVQDFPLGRQVLPVRAHDRLTSPGAVRLRLNGEQALLVTSYRSGATGLGKNHFPPDRLEPTSASFPDAAPLFLDNDTLTYRPIIALIEAVPVAADDLAAAVIRVLESGGLRCGAVSLDGQNRLGTKLGCVNRPPAWCWQQLASELILWQGARAIVAGPAQEEEVDTVEYAEALHRVGQDVDSLVIDLGCRWTPRLFRAVLPIATHIWIVTRPGQWSGVEMRLEQAEYSGWTDMTRVRIVLIGDGPVPVMNFGVPLAGVLPDLAGERVRAFVLREVGRKP